MTGVQTCALPIFLAGLLVKPISNFFMTSIEKSFTDEQRKKTGADNKGNSTPPDLPQAEQNRREQI